ncbi:hypothetical protein D3C73_1448540 [compost metagenome]
MRVRVVNILEVVYVHIEHEQLFSQPLRPANQPGENALNEPAIIRPGQVVSLQEPQQRIESLAA